MPAKQLPAKQQLAIVSACAAGLTIAETASRVGCSSIGSRNRRSQGRKFACDGPDFHAINLGGVPERCGWSGACRQTLRVGSNSAGTGAEDR